MCLGLYDVCVYMHVMGMYDLASVSASTRVSWYAYRGQRVNLRCRQGLSSWLRQGLSLCSSCHTYQASWDPAVSTSSFIIETLVFRCRHSCPVLYTLWTIEFRFSCLHSKLYTLSLLSSPCFFLLLLLLCVYNLHIVGVHVSVHL